MKQSQQFLESAANCTQIAEDAKKGLILGEAVKTAWAVYIATHPAANVDDQRRCSLSRHLEARLQAGEKDFEELVCSGLSYLDRVPADPW
jgi:hypothetical protein